MGYGYSVDLRERVVAAWERGEGTYEELAARFSVGRATVNRWLRRKRETGSIAPKPVGGGHPTVFDERGLVVLEELVCAHPDATLEELLKYWLQAGGGAVSRAALHRALRKKLGYTLKKSRSHSTKRTPSGSSD